MLLAAGRPKTLIVYQTEPDPLLRRVHAAIVAEQKESEQQPNRDRRCIATYTTHEGADSLSVDSIEETDLLAIHTVHHADRLYAELQRHGGRVRRWILLMSTQAFGERAEGSEGPGLLPAMRRWMQERPEWSVIYHTDRQYGLTLLSRDPADKPKLPSKIKMAANLAKSLAAHVADGAGKASQEQFEARLAVCSLCDQRRDDRCVVCGCFIDKKAAMRSSVCPLGKWPS